MIKILLFVLTTTLFMNSCSPVRQTARIGSSSQSKELDKRTIDKNDSTISIETDNQERKINETQTQIGDTLVIQLPDVVQTNVKPNKIIDKNPAGDKVDDGDNESIKKELDAAIILYENNKIDDAQKKLMTILSTLSKENRQYYQARYYLTECSIAKNRTKEAKKELEELYKIETLEDDILEKVILRLGQIACINKNIEKANEYFEELKDRFPESELINLANCNFIKKK